MTIDADSPVWAIVNKSNNNFVRTKTGIRAYSSRAEAREHCLAGEQKVVKLTARDASFNYR